MKKSTTTAAAAIVTVKEVFVKKVYVNSMKVREQKAEASKRFRERAAFVVANPGAQIPTELQARVGYQKGNQTLDTSAMSAEQILKLDAHREGKRLATKRFHFKKNNPTAELPAELQVSVREPKAAKVAAVKVPKAAKVVVVEAQITLADMVAEQGDMAFKMTPLGTSGYTLRKYQVTGDKKKQVAQTYVKKTDLPQTASQWNALIAQA